MDLPNITQRQRDPVGAELGPSPKVSALSSDTMPAFKELTV